MKVNEILKETIAELVVKPVPEERKVVLENMVNYIRRKLQADESVILNFICTHNSRRSQFSQIWAQFAADYHGVPVRCLSGGVEVTAFNERAVESAKRLGFEVNATPETLSASNPIYEVSYGGDVRLRAFSKLFDDAENSAESFAAVMTCSHADEHCPFIPGTEQRIPVRYEDPKAFDDTPNEAAAYDERSKQIGSEMLYAFSLLA
ncbi:MAG: hypothetical protein RL754_371 [Bacteroidota bacterium]|jgi:arsenate reductase